MSLRKFFRYACAMPLLLLMFSAVSPAADPKPGSQDPAQSPSAPTPPLAPPAPPSKIDPGIQKQPDTVPNPKAVVPPPVVDQNMVVDPEKPRAGNNPPKPGTPSQPK
jgi:hypothetical protein